jgi:hypothetical protein
VFGHVISNVSCSPLSYAYRPIHALGIVARRPHEVPEFIEMMIRLDLTRLNLVLRSTGLVDALETWYFVTYLGMHRELGKLQLKSRPIIPEGSFLHWYDYGENT